MGSPFLYERGRDAALAGKICRKLAWRNSRCMLGFPIKFMRNLIRPLLLSFALVSTLQAGRTPNFAIFESRVYTINSGMDVVLALTPEQAGKIEEAHMAWNDDPELKATREAFSQSKDAPPEQAIAAKGAFYSQQKVSRAKYDEALAGILSGEQRALVESLNDFAKVVAKEAGNEGTWSERMARLKEIGTSHLSDVLSPAQLQLLNATPTAE